MRTLLLFAVALPLSAAPLADVKDQEKVQGAWVVTRAEKRGEAVKEAEGKMTLLFKGDELTVDSGKQETVKFTLDPAKTPKGIDFVSPDGEKSAGIYKLDGDVFVICFAKGGARPTEFSSKGDNRALLELKRVKK